MNAQLLLVEVFIFFKVTMALTWNTVMTDSMELDGLEQCMASLGCPVTGLLYGQPRSLALLPVNNQTDPDLIHDVYSVCASEYNYTNYLSVVDQVLSDMVDPELTSITVLLIDPVEIGATFDQFEYIDGNLTSEHLSNNLAKRGADGTVTVRHDITTNNCGNIQPLALFKQGKCNTFRTSPYDKSFRVDWINTVVGLSIRAWPHHGCTKGGSQTYIIGKNTRYCVPRNTYSATFRTSNVL